MTLQLTQPIVREEYLLGDNEREVRYTGLKEFLATGTRHMFARFTEGAKDNIELTLIKDEDLLFDGITVKAQDNRYITMILRSNADDLSQRELWKQQASMLGGNSR